MRVGPNHVSVADASVVPLVYSITTKFYKSDFYRLFDVPGPHGPVSTVFSERSEAQHKIMKRRRERLLDDDDEGL